MMKKFISGILFLLLAAGCSKPYLEVETPAGQMPVPAANPTHQSVEQGLQNAFNADVVVTVSADEMEQIKDFERSYQGMQRPRIAVLFNRSLNDRISEWESDRRVAFAGSGTIEGAYSGGQDDVSSAFVPVGHSPQDDVRHGKTAAQGSGWVAVQNRVREADPRELSWDFQDGFVKPWMDAGVNLIDRATIIRLTAAQQGNADALNQKQVETDALKGYADIFIEVLVDDLFEKEGYYRFRVSVKDIVTGEMLAHNVTKYPDPDATSLAVGQKYEATEKGFVVKQDAFEAGKLLALSVMNDMAARM